MHNRTAFLNTIARALGSPAALRTARDVAPVNDYANRAPDRTFSFPQQRCDAFVQFASEVRMARCERP